MTYGPKPRAVEARFWEKVRLGPGCWEWQANRTSKGYGVFRINEPRKQVTAQRMAWQLTYGPIPDGLFVLHRCDNPPCCNPDHLFLGTRGDNNRDAKAKGRNATGLRHGFHAKPGAIRKNPADGRFVVVTGKALYRSASRLHGPEATR